MTAYTRGHTLTSLASLPRLTMVMPVAHGDLDTSKQASGTVEVGELVEPVSASGANAWQADGAPQGRVASVTAALTSANAYKGMKRYGVAMRQVEHSTLFSDPNSTNTNIAQANTDLDHGDWVRVAYSGTFQTTLVASGASATVGDNFVPGAPLTYDPDAGRPDDITGTGAWRAATASDLVLAESKGFKRIGTAGILTFRLLP